MRKFAPPRQLNRWVTKLGEFHMARSLADDDADRATILSYLKTRPSEHCEEAEISAATGIAKMHVRRLIRGTSGIDERLLVAGKVCWYPPADPMEN
jgi:hypothetical protein